MKERFIQELTPTIGEKERLKSRLQSVVESIKIPDNWEVLLQDNPYRLAKDVGISQDGIYSNKDVIEALRTAMYEYAQEINNREGDERAHMRDDQYHIAVDYAKKLFEIRDAIQSHIEEINSDIIESTVDPERDCDELQTKKFIIKMNKDSAHYPEDCWSPEKLMDMSMEEYLKHVAKYSSGRSFCHVFPLISFKKGEIVTGVGGTHRSEEGFERVREGASSIQINFTPERVDQETNTYDHRNYIGLKDGGDVYYPAEVILDNYAFLNLPYVKEGNQSDWVSSEWRNVAPPENPGSQLHAISLKLGIVFFDKSFEKEYEKMITENPELKLPRVVFVSDYEREGDPLGLNQLLEESGVNKKAGDLPHIANIIRPIDKINGISVFGTAKAKENWGRSNSY